MTVSLDKPQPINWLSDSDLQISDTTTTLPIGATLTGTPQGRYTIRLPLDWRELVVEILGDLPVWLEPTVRSFEGLPLLDSGWDSYGSQPIDPSCIVAALEFALNTFCDDTPSPSVVPTSRGGLQFEWHTAGVDLEIEFLSPTRVYGLFEDNVTGKAWEQDLTYNRQDVIEAISILSERR